MHVKSYNCPIEDTIINNLVKTIDKEIPLLFDYLKTKKSCQ